MDAIQKIKHFRHDKFSDECCFEPESEEHIEMKKFFMDSLNLPKECLEYRCLGYARPDIYLPEHKIAIEVQASALSVDKIIQRTQNYTDNGVFVLWCFHIQLFKKHHKIPKFIDCVSNWGYGFVYVYNGKKIFAKSCGSKFGFFPYDLNTANGFQHIGGDSQVRFSVDHFIKVRAVDDMNRDSEEDLKVVLFKKLYDWINILQERKQKQIEWIKRKQEEQDKRDIEEQDKWREYNAKLCRERYEFDERLKIQLKETKQREKENLERINNSTIMAQQYLSIFKGMKSRGFLSSFSNDGFIKARRDKGETIDLIYSALKILEDCGDIKRKEGRIFILEKSEKPPEPLKIVETTQIHKEPKNDNNYKGFKMDVEHLEGYGALYKVVLKDGVVFCSESIDNVKNRIDNDLNKI